MKYRIVIICLLLAFQACNTGNQEPETALNTGNAFIRASLDGKFDDAENLLLKDTANIQMFNTYKRYYRDMPAENKQKYKAASYNINKFLQVDDSTGIINYSNSYMHEPMEIKLVRINNVWKIDFKYTSSGNKTIDPK